MDINRIKKHLFIVMGCEHWNPLGVIRSLGENGIYPVVMLVKSDVKIASVSRYVEKRKLYIVNSYEEMYKILLKKFSHYKLKPFIIPCDDNITELLDKKWDKIKDSFFVSNAGESGRITHFMNKWTICELARKNGLNIAASWQVKKGEIPQDIVYPVITKPLTSYVGWKNDYYVCYTEKELKDAFKVIKGEDILLQQFISKVNELCLDGIVVNHGKDLFIAIASKYTYILPDYYSMEMVVSNFNDKYFQDVLNKMFKEIGYEGIFSAEFMIDKDGKFWFLEINLRNSGWSYASTKLGMNLPLLWADGMLNGKKPINARKRIPDNYIALAEVSDFEHRVRRLKQISALKWFKGVLNADCLYVWNSRDIKPAIIYWYCKIIRFIKKKI